MLSDVYWPIGHRFVCFEPPDFVNAPGTKSLDFLWAAERVIGIRPGAEMNDAAVLTARNQSNCSKSPDHALLRPSQSFQVTPGSRGNVPGLLLGNDLAFTAEAKFRHFSC